MHSKEWGSLANTGQLTRLAIRNAEIRIHGLPHQTVSSEGLDMGASSTLVLFPGGGSCPLTKKYLAPLPRPLTLLVPDGSWNQAKKMMRRVPMLRHAHRITLEGPSLGLRCSRRNIGADRTSTFEAIARTLGILEGQETENHLLGFFREVLDRRRQI
jgi:DTW domain-containing protein YfiP